MKKAVIILLLVFSATLFAQSEIKITSKKCISKKGYHLRLKRVFDDSRCPENVSCIWAGEVSIEMEVYKDKKIIEEKTLLLNINNSEENIKWLTNYLPKKSNSIKSITVFPYPKEGQIVKSKNQFVKINYHD